MTTRRWAIAGIAVAMLALSIGGEWVSIHHGVTENHLIDLLGGLRTTFDKVVLGIIYGAPALLSAVIVLAFDPRSAGCAQCAREFAPFPSRVAFVDAMYAYRRVSFALVLLFFAAVWLRWRRATPAERRELAPLWVAIYVIAVVYLLGRGRGLLRRRRVPGERGAVRAGFRRLRPVVQAERIAACRSRRRWRRRSRREQGHRAARP